MSQQTQRIWRWVWVSAAVAGVAVLLLLAARGPRYSHRGYTIVTIAPFTNAVFHASFQARVFPSLPGVRLEPSGTNLIRVVADAVTAEEARKLSKDATATLGIAVQNEYGARLSVLDFGRSTHGHLSSDPGEVAFMTGVIARWPNL